MSCKYHEAVVFSEQDPGQTSSGDLWCFQIPYIPSLDNVTILPLCEPQIYAKQFSKYEKLCLTFV